MKYQNHLSFEKHLASSSPHHFSHVYLVIIGDQEERSKVLHSISSRLISQGAFLEKLDADTDLCKVFDALQSPSLFGGEPVVLLDGCEAFKKKESDLLSNFLETRLFSGYLILGSKGKTPLTKVVEKVGVVLDMGEEKPWEKEKRLAQFVIARAKDAGKWMSQDAAELLLERLGVDVAMLSSEVDKLICYVGERPTIERSDIFRISSSQSLLTLWEMAEQVVWEGKREFDEALFPSLIFALRSQLQIGLKITSLLENKVPFQEWSPYLPKMWPKILEKRKEQAMKKGSLFFRKGLDLLLKIESMSRGGSNQTGAFLDLFFLSMSTHGRR